MYRIRSTLLLLALTACAVGPDYHLPEMKLPDHWLSSPAPQDDKAPIEQAWWKRFSDPALDTLIAKASTGNLDLQIAQSRIAQARAARSAASADLLPTGNATGSAERQANRVAFPGPIDLTKPFNLYQAGFDASWELDIFGGKRRATEAAGAELKQAEATRDDVRVTLLAEVARTYVAIRENQRQMAIASDNIAATENALRIARERFASGTTAGVDVARADAEVQQARAQLPRLASELAASEFAMDVLLGEQPGATHVIVAAPAPIPAANSALVLAAPSSVIADRPDIRAAERALAAATAQQGVAMAKLFPDISLSGFVGLLATDPSHVLEAGSKSWDVAGSVAWPILNYGKLSAGIDASDAKQQEALLTYRKSVIAALSDVETTVTSYTKQEERRASLAAAADNQQHAVDVAQMRYKQGMTSFSDVIDAQRVLYTAQQSLAEAQSQSSQDLIAVYKSLGGGWKDAPTTPAAPQS